MTAAAAAVCPSLLWTMYLFIHIILPAQCIYANIPLIFQAQTNCWISMMSESQVKYRQGRSAGFLKNKKTDFKFQKKNLSASIRKFFSCENSVVHLHPSSRISALYGSYMILPKRTHARQCNYYIHTGNKRSKDIYASPRRPGFSLCV
jgi:hypothetical protein